MMTFKYIMAEVKPVIPFLVLPWAILELTELTMYVFGNKQALGNKPTFESTFFWAWRGY